MRRLALVCLLLTLPLELAAQRLAIRFLDVGQGDATLITLEGRHVLIDAGPNREAVARYLVSQGVDTLDLVIASHAHADHIGGMAQVLRTIPVRFYLDNGRPYTTAT
jgi:competence protein ComEC